nr:MAG TPA: hypothetical protein [Caudoviricetes sp.]
MANSPYFVNSVNRASGDTKKFFKMLDKLVAIWYNRSKDGGKYDRHQ